MTPTPIIELTADRGSMMSSSVTEEVISKVDEDSSSDSDMDDGSDSEWAGYNVLAETEPEWDVDSFDGHEFKINPRVRKMYGRHQQHYDEYYNDRLEAFKSKGFLPDTLNGIDDVDLDGKMDGYNSTRDFMAELANVCVKKHNETKGTTLELVNVARVTARGAATWRLYITFMAREFSDGPLVEYQAKVIVFLGDEERPVPVLCRPSPKPGTEIYINLKTVCIVDAREGDLYQITQTESTILVVSKHPSGKNRTTRDELVDTYIWLPCALGNSTRTRVDEEDDGDTETEGESESEVGDGSVTYGDYKVIEDLPKPDPEWDVDSFDGLEYESDPELRARFANDNAYMEYREVRIQALENRGFLPDPFNFIDAIQNLDGPAYDNMTNREYLAGLASSCVKKLNDLKAKTVEFVSIVRATTTGGGASWKVYITFMAREYPNGPLMEYQAKAMDFVGDRSPVPILCRPAPKPLTLP